METSYVNKITGFVIALVLGAILVGGMLAPTVAGIQTTIGDTVAYDNIQSGYTYRLTEKNENITLKVTGSGGDIYFNGEAITEDGFAIVTDSVTVRAATSVKQFMVTTPTQSLDLRAGWNAKFTITFEDGTCTIVDDATTTTTETVTYSWMFAPSDNGEWVTVTGNSTHYVNSIKDIICNGYYSTGDNDTGYTIRNGIATVSDTTYTAGLNYTLTPVAGTTDVYTVSSFSIKVDEESFTPWFMLIKRDIVGHEASGPFYTMFGVITLLAIVMLVVIAANAVKGKYN